MARVAKPTYHRTGPLVAFGRRVRALRHARGWSQEELAHRASMHATYVSSVERGERNISLLNVLALGEAFDADPGVLLTSDAESFRRALLVGSNAPARARR